MWNINDCCSCCQWISHREKSLEKLEKKSQKSLLYYQKKAFHSSVFSPLVSDCTHWKVPQQFENPSQISQGAWWYSGQAVDTFMLGAKFHSSQQSRLRFYLSSSYMIFSSEKMFDLTLIRSLFLLLWESTKMRSNSAWVWPTLSESSLYLSDLKMQISKCKIRKSFLIGVQRPESFRWYYG